jgi:peptidoglycan/LPS O-acetylase OafA/YrhL
LGSEHRYRVLDGWRGISILAVLACHLLPLGLRPWALNASAGYFGMALFFTLSGFLITTFLLKHADVKDFLIRRLCRIVPLSWAALVVGLLMAHAPRQDWLPNFLFFANYPPFWLTSVTGHFWSLCVEVQFYAAVALVFGLFGRRGLLVAIPAGALVVTALRVYTGTYDSVVTYLRVDEILAGGILAFVYAGEFGRGIPTVLGKLNPWVMLALYCASTLDSPLAYMRPYLAAALVGSTLLGDENAFYGALKTRSLAYVAQISYALYVFHPLLAHTWLGSGSKLVKYAKRPLLFAACFLTAHVSTFYYENRWIALGKRLSERRRVVLTAA